MSQQDNNQMQQHFYRASAADFGKIPGSPMAYWAPSVLFTIFSNSKKFNHFLDAREGLATGNNQKHVRYHFEVSRNSVGRGFSSRIAAAQSGLKWFPYNKGGEFRKWYGNDLYVVNWLNDGKELQETLHPSGERIWAHNFNLDYIFKPSVSWSDITTKGLSARLFPEGFLFDATGLSAFERNNNFDFRDTAAAICNSKIGSYIAAMLNPTLHFKSGDFSEMPVVNSGKQFNTYQVNKAYELSFDDWNAFEVSWDFIGMPLLLSEYRQATFKATYQNIRINWIETTLAMQRLEEENNRILIDAYGLQDELTPEVQLSEITLTCNPHYRYGNNLTDEEREARLQSDTIAELISYAIGCMMGRYSLDREGLVYAHVGNEGFKALVEEGAYATFAADEDGILPLSTDSWFEDDVATRLEAFVCTVWGKETLEENLQFIADSLCLAAIKPVKKGGETARETLRRYLSTQFYKDHLKTYKKRPIYWLFSSGKEKAFECLVYLHRYNEATLPRMRTEYVTPLLGQMAGRIERLRLQQAEASTAEAKRIGKEIDSLTKQLSELRAFDDQLKHHADMRITLDLDDGVKVNYGKFGTLLSDVKAITGDKGE
ncbi:BREX-1 system adenine-specific DNA-methyltransferase PglX [Aeromonas salmonicida]